ncbi:hypothetical protein BDF14DRAFT_1841406 [Spinellus fusiger]|nr:hypothetical protein BDF14DRAFT_1841406 [Spinellus fusiger]
MYFYSPTPNTKTLIKTVHGLKHYIRSPIRLTIDVDPKYVNDKGDRIVCYPGSVFEGSVRMRVYEPIVGHTVKLLFKGLERVNYDAMGWGKAKKEGRLFSIRAPLWRAPHDEEEADTPHLLPGEYSFPFVCELPLVNFPPSFEHHFIASTFSLVASFERDNGEPIYSEPFFAYFQPIIEIEPIKSATEYTEAYRVSNNTFLYFTIPRLSYNILDTQHLSIKISTYKNKFSERSSHPNYYLRVYLKRNLTIFHAGYSRNEDITITQLECRIDRYNKGSNHHESEESKNSHEITVHLPLEALAQVASLEYSNRFSIHYRLFVSMKLRHSLISSYKNIFSAPIDFGTLSPGMRSPEGLIFFADEGRSRQSVPLPRPKFLKPAQTDDQLPLYDMTRPPSYSTNIRANE